MDLIYINELENNVLQELTKSNGHQAKISIILPVQQEVDKREENRIRLKNLVKEAQRKLSAWSSRDPDVEDLLAPVESFANGGRFMELTHPGLVIYIADGLSRFYQLPYAPQELVTVGPYFNIKPLMPLRDREDFYILTLSQQDVRLLNVQQREIERVNLEDMPQSLDEALRWDDPEKQLQWHSETGRLQQGEGRAAMFHGHGVATKETHKENLLRYFQLLDKGINKILANETAPLILAGVDYLLPIYREANSYGNLLDKEIQGNLEHLSDEEIREKAWPTIQKYLQEQWDMMIDRYHELAATDLASADIQAVVSTAQQGRVNTLFVAIDDQAWGDFDPQNGQITRTADPQPGGVDLLNLAAIYTIRNAGDVYAKERASLPEEAPLSAIFRF